MPSEPETPHKLFLPWPDIVSLVAAAKFQMDFSGYVPEGVLAIGRGGTIPARLFSEEFNAPMYFMGLSGYTEVYQPLTPSVRDECLALGASLLLVDDLWDTGETIKTMKRMFPLARTATLLVKGWEQPAEVDFTGVVTMNDNWVVFPWERDNSSN